MEDAIVFQRLSKDIFLFAVFDGHGGVEVSQYCSKHLAPILQARESFKNKDYPKALEETFQELDKKLGSE